MEKVFRVRISASFTAEPLEGPLDFWLQKLEPGGTIEFAPFNQIFQTLLDPAGLFLTNPQGLNVAVIRWQDLGSGSQIAENAAQLLQTLEQSAARSPVPLLVCTTPASVSFLSGLHNAELVETLDRQLAAKLERLPGTYFLGRREIDSLYPVPGYDDPTSDRIGHVPYTADYFHVLATAIARKLAALRRPPFKVAVLDLDNTLWAGVAGEDGPAGVQLGPAQLALQQFFLAQREKGMLLALCSKNNEEDALEVFRQRPEMPLQLEHFAATRINWEPKSTNLRSLAGELSLGLDSFVFIDDDHKECAEVQADCPEILTLQLPADPTEIPAFLHHVWAFDRVAVTSADRERSQSYSREKERTQFEKQTSSLQEFVAGLQLRVSIDVMVPDQLARVSQLTQRTNQFNTTTIRQSENEITNSGLDVLTVDVSDRFGDYGLVGAVLYRTATRDLVVESFMLSCRALGRGVEHRIVQHLGYLAGERGCSRLRFAFAETAKNIPAKNFLESIARAAGEFSIDAKDALKLAYKPLESPLSANVSLSLAPASAPVRTGFTDYAWIARECRTVEQLAAQMRSQRSPAGASDSSPVASLDAPRNENERKLAAIWADTLGLEKVGIHSSFFDLGGYSLLAVELLRNIIDTFGVEDLTLSAVLEAPTVARFAALLEHNTQPKFSCLVPIRAEGSRLPLYCVHGAGGNVLSLRGLAMNLSPDQPFWCLQAKGLDGSPPLEDLKETAALYISEIRLVQPNGPYLLSGGSYGGLFAYEMAQQLTAQGEEVALLAMFDTYNLAYGNMIPRPKLIYYTGRFFFERVAAQLLTLLTTPLNQWPGKLNSTRRALGQHLERFTSSFGTKPQIESQPMPAGPEMVDGGDATGVTEVLVRVRDATMRAAESYVPQPYSGRVALFTATTKMVEPYRDRFLGWKPLIKGSLDEYCITGDHLRITGLPELAEKLDALLAHVQTEIVPPAKPSFVSSLEVQ